MGNSSRVRTYPLKQVVGVRATHQRPRDGGSPESHTPLGGSPSGPYRHSMIGHHHDRGVHQTPRGYQVPSSSDPKLGVSKRIYCIFFFSKMSL